MENRTVDAMGQACPMPVILAKKALESMNGAGTLTVLVDNEIAVQNVLRLASGSGYAAAGEKVSDQQYRVTITVSGTSTAPEAPAPEACIPDQRGDYVVAIGCGTMGSGSEELGKTLMKGFLYALTQLDKLPRTILFYNGGAFLPTEGSASLEDLKNMEAQGVEILTCGTCLDYYGLKPKLAVGGITNMYSIAQILTQASRVIKP